MIAQRSIYSNNDYKLYHIVLELSKLSYCQDKRVGAIVMNDTTGVIVGSGYNRINYCNNECNKTCNVQHAEVMATMQLPSINSRIYTLYTNLFPCEECQREAAVKGVKRIVVFGPRGTKKDTESVDIELLPDIAAWLLTYNGRENRDGSRNCRQIFQGEMSELSTAISNHDAREDRDETKQALMDAMIEEAVDVDLQYIIFQKTIWPQKEKGEGAHKWNKLIDKFKHYFLITQ